MEGGESRGDGDEGGAPEAGVEVGVVGFAEVGPDLEAWRAGGWGEEGGEGVEGGFEGACRGRDEDEGWCGGGGGEGDEFSGGFAGWGEGWVVVVDAGRLLA